MTFREGKVTGPALRHSAGPLPSSVRPAPKERAFNPRWLLPPHGPRCVSRPTIDKPRRLAQAAGLFAFRGAPGC
jgi:hypothetical protein